MIHRTAALLLILVSPITHAGSYLSADELPPDVKPFVTEGTRALSLSGADLNGDGLQDFVLVLERQGAENLKSGQRPLLVLVRQADGSLLEARRNNDIVSCSTCGGVFGDPFHGVSAGPKTFTVSHYGGSNLRWSVQYTFNYSRRDDTWQLVRVEESHFRVTEPENVSTSIYVPPEDFGKIDIADFDPDNWKGQGPR